MKTKVALLLILMLLPGLASAAKVHSGAPGCMSAELLDQLLHAILNNDQATGETLLQNGCIILNQDVDAKLLEARADKVHVTVSNDKGSLDMWVPIKYYAE